MKRKANCCLSLLMAVLMCFSLLTITATRAHASTEYVYNWGTRGEAATTLSESAAAFYVENNTTYASLSQFSGGTSYADAPSSALYHALQQLMTDAHDYETSYQGTRDLYQYTDCQNSGNPSTISSFYSGKAIGPAWDEGSTWNREHIWPNSKGDASGNGENDIMMLRPTASSENISRGNTAYGESAGYYNPNSVSNGNYDLRGDVARIVLYVYTRWGNTTSMWGSDGVIESQDILLKWIEQDPVDTWELGRNDSVQSITGTRNVFVDYPELAFLLFGQQIPATMSTPSNNKTPTSHTHSYGLGVVTAPTCTKQGYTTYTCSDLDCGNVYTTDYTNMVSHTYVDGVCSCGATNQIVGTGESATITFDETSKRTEYSTSQQVWTENGITVTNAKASSSTSVGDYFNPARFYAGSSLTIAYPGMIKIEFTCNSYKSEYVTALVDSATTGTVSSDGVVVTIVLDDAADIYSIAEFTKQVRVDSITVYAAGNDASIDVLDAPTITVTTNADSGKPVVSWTAIENATGYEVWYSNTKTGTYTKLFTTDSDELTVTHTSTEVGNTYFYQVYAINDTQTSDPSASKGVYCDLARPAVTVTTRASDGKPYIKWTEVEGATSYKVYRSTTKNGTYTLMYTAPANDFDVYHTGATVGSAYFYKVVAVYGDNTSCNSAMTAAKGVWCDLPAPTVTVTVRASDGKPYIKWTKVEGATNYKVYRSTTKNGTYSLMYTAPANDFDVYHTGATAEQTWFYKVIAVYGSNTSCNSGYSTAKGVWCDLARPTLTVSLNSSGKPYLKWNAVSGADSYKVYRSTDGVNYALMYTAKADDLDVNHTGAVTGTTYYYKVRAISSTSSSANSAYSVVATITP